MNKKTYITPDIRQVDLQNEDQLLATSSGDGMPHETPDGLIFDGPGGSFGEDEDIATRRSSMWGDE